MKKERIAGINGYTIPCRHTLAAGQRMAVLIAHGFGSSKESPTALMLERELPKIGIGTFAFDFPAHGESPVDGEQLTVDHCIDDMAMAEETIKTLAPEAKVGYFGSSFGAYITLLYLAYGRGEGRRAFLRSAAVEMPKLFSNKTPEQQKQLSEQGFVILDLDYVRPLKLTEAFFRSLERQDVFQIYRNGEAVLRMVHGDCDETASFEAARRFADKFGAELIPFPGGDHRLSLPGMPERVGELAANFFLQEID